MQHTLIKSTQRLGTMPSDNGSPVHAYVVVTVEITEQTTQAGAFMTINHEPAPPTYQRLSITGEVYQPGEQRGYPSESGQITERLTDIAKPAAGWDFGEIRELAQIWKRWHLNDLNAACAHMDTETLVREPDGFGGERIACGAANTCPESGYTYGHAWLVEPLPDDVIDDIKHLMRDRSSDLYAERGYDMSGHPYPKPQEA